MTKTTYTQLQCKRDLLARVLPKLGEDSLFIQDLRDQIVALEFAEATGQTTAKAAYFCRPLD